MIPSHELERKFNEAIGVRKGNRTMAASTERLTYSVREAAELLGISKNSCYQGCLKGEIPHIKIGKRILIPKTQLEALLVGNNGDHQEVSQ